MYVMLAHTAMCMTINFRSYVSVVLAAFIGLAVIHELYARVARLTCWAGGYERNAWMAYCNSERYGVYDVDAVWFKGEPEVAAAIAKAQILTLSDSHLQNALSLGGASEWFSSHHFNVYFLGLPSAQSGFGELLWERIRPHPKVLIFDASPYFTGGMGESEDSIIKDSKSRQAEVMELKQFQDFHQHFCTKLPKLCGQNFAYFKSRVDGHWIFPNPDARPLLSPGSVPNDRTRIQIESAPDELVPLYPQYLKAAQSFISKIDMPRHCIVITHVPGPDSMPGLAQFLAGSLGVTRVEPTSPPMATFDGTHLTPSSSRQWTQAFLLELEPVLQSCISNAGPAPTSFRPVLVQPDEVAESDRK